MLQAINDRIKGWLGAFVVALIALPFAFWGIQSYLGGGDESIAAKVNDTEIGVRELEWGVSRQRQMLAQRYEGKIPFEDRVLRQQVLEQLINLKVLNQATHESGYRISDDMLMDSIRQAFSRDGGFDRLLFESVLQSQGMTEAMFMQQMKQDLRVQQLQQGIISSAVASSAEVKRMAQLEYQTRDFSRVRFDVGHFASNVEPTDEQIQSAYASSPGSYMTPDRVKIDYVELKGGMLADEIAVDEDRIKQMYQDYRAHAARQESRRARHILLKVDDDKEAVVDRLNDIRKRILAGESFAELAKEYSEDPVSAGDGGDLDWIEAGQMVKPFEEALFALDKGEVSEIVETRFGLHLIKLEDIKSEDVKTLAEMRPGYIKDLTAEQVSSIFYDMSEAMAVAAYENPHSLGAVVDALNVKTEIKTSDLFDRNSGTGIAQHDKIRRAAFSPAVFENGVNSDIIELAPDHIVVLRINEHIPASVKPLEQVKQQIIARLKRDKGRQFALQAAQEARTRLEQGQEIKSVLAEGVSFEQKTDVARTDTTVPAEIINQVFGMTPAQDGAPGYTLVDASAGDISLVRLDAVNTPDNVEPDRLAKIRQQLIQRIAYKELESVVDSIVAKADIYRNPKVLE